MPVLWTHAEKLLLASTSATRLALLVSAGLPVETQNSDIDERAVEEAAAHEALDPPALAGRLAAEKALAVSRRHPERVVLGADQVLECEGAVFHKPADRDAARAHLAALSGRRHALHSAGAIAVGGQVIERFAASAHLTMRPLTEQGIDLYLALAGPDVLRSVGVYQLEGFGIHLFETVEGDHSTILGLPLLPLLASLRRLGSLAL
ncbi:Maf family protein [Microvirga lotononidis]|uniref:Nucleoside triphosphate pyrophosphatase n=1 Tax=Microvirga lotononidis TaxID=864069 RepID=I4YZ07_9HYPH|nr:Maf family protein [Microvirga lotononidis]EIM29199.1 nucleotide-binding protein implicated in inhibition of septum formation [Microvirga lotononidis]WQO29038.1 Maf family protein [Microvirga lotononidis]